jgi:2-polyprenyl-6-hydroxyphenyl methylase/3-demethylubiquinone-9 3-methyltransferase
LLSIINSKDITWLAITGKAAREKEKRMRIRWRIAQAAEIRWWQFYLHRRDPAAYLNAKRAYWRRVLRAAGVSVPGGAAVLDAGCGPAGIFLVLDHCRVDAVDPLLEQYEARLPHFSRSAFPWVRFHTGLLEQFDAPAAYDYVFCLNALNHVADLELAADRLLRALRPGGTLVLSVDAHRHALLKPLFRALPGDILHPHQHGLADYRSLLESRSCCIRRTVRLKRGRIFDYWLLVGERSA